MRRNGWKMSAEIESQGRARSAEGSDKIRLQARADFEDVPQRLSFSPDFPHPPAWFRLCFVHESYKHPTHPPFLSYPRRPPTMMRHTPLQVSRTISASSKSHTFRAFYAVRLHLPHSQKSCLSSLHRPYEVIDHTLSQRIWKLLPRRMCVSVIVFFLVFVTKLSIE